MRILTLAFAAAFALSFLTVTAEPAQAVGLCADESGNNSNPDLYNNMGGPGSDCEGVFCMGYSNGNWNTCVLEPIYCSSLAPCPPPPTTASSSTTTVCTAGDLYNNAQGPSSGCDGYLCTGYANGEWDTCVLDCTTDGCPRIEDPCRSLMCQPPMDP